MFRCFDLQILTEVFNVDQETAQQLQRPNDQRAHIVMVERGLQVIRPPIQSDQYEQQVPWNGLEETVCSAKITLNINDAKKADFFNPQAGWTTHLNSFKWSSLVPREMFLTERCRVTILDNERTQHTLRDKRKHEDADRKQHGTSSVRRHCPGTPSSGDPTEFRSGETSSRTRVPMDSIQDQGQRHDQHFGRTHV